MPWRDDRRRSPGISAQLPGHIIWNETTLAKARSSVIVAATGNQQTSDLPAGRDNFTCFAVDECDGDAGSFEHIEERDPIDSCSFPWLRL